jgi:hypothetical protein
MATVAACHRATSVRAVGSSSGKPWFEDRPLDGTGESRLGALLAPRPCRRARRRRRHVAVTSAPAEELLAPTLQRGAILEDFGALARTAVADPAQHNPQAQLAKERAAFGQPVDAEAVLLRVHKTELEIAEIVGVGANAQYLSIRATNGKGLVA